MAAASQSLCGARSRHWSPCSAFLRVDCGTVAVSATEWSFENERSELWSKWCGLLWAVIWGGAFQNNQVIETGRWGCRRSFLKCGTCVCSLKFQKQMHLSSEQSEWPDLHTRTWEGGFEKWLDYWNQQGRAQDWKSTREGKEGNNYCYWKSWGHRGICWSLHMKVIVSRKLPMVNW